MSHRQRHLPQLLAALGVSVCFSSMAVFANTEAMSKETQAKMSPDDSLQALKEGNERFVNNKARDRDLLAQVKETSAGQFPFAVVLGCIDSRVPPEAVFDQGIGDIFSARVAGNFANTDIIGSLEFATQIAGSNLIVVLGHTQCGAVKGAADGAQLGNLTQTLSNLAPAIYAVGTAKGERSSGNSEFVQAVTEENVSLTVKNLTERSAVLSTLVESEKLKIVGAVYDVETGRVDFVD